MERLLHHFRRWNAHRESSELEKKLKETANERLAPVVQCALEFSGDDTFGGLGLSFVHAAFTELFECRTFLQYSYAFSYFQIQDKGRQRRRLLAEKLVFEENQGDVEIVTGQISDVVARRNIGATQTQIRFLTAAAAEKRRSYSDLMVNILVDMRKAENAEKGIEKKSKEFRRLPSKIVTQLSSLRSSRNNSSGIQNISGCSPSGGSTSSRQGAGTTSTTGRRPCSLVVLRKPTRAVPGLITRVRLTTRVDEGVPCAPLF